MLTIKEVLEFLTANKENEELSVLFEEGGLFADKVNKNPSLTPDLVLDFLKTDEGQTLIQPIVDKRVSDAVKKRDKYHEGIIESEVKRRLAAEILKLNPTEEPWQKEIRELREENEKEKKERAKENLKRQIVEEAARIGVDPFFIEDYLPESYEVGQLYLQKIKNRDKQIEEKITNDLLTRGQKPGAGADPGKPKVKSDLSKLSLAEMIKMEENGELDKI